MAPGRAAPARLQPDEGPDAGETCDFVADGPGVTPVPGQNQKPIFSSGAAAAARSLQNHPQASGQRPRIHPESHTATRRGTNIRTSIKALSGADVCHGTFSGMENGRPASGSFEVSRTCVVLGSRFGQLHQPPNRTRNRRQRSPEWFQKVVDKARDEIGMGQAYGAPGSAVSTAGQAGLSTVQGVLLDSIRNGSTVGSGSPASAVAGPARQLRVVAEMGPLPSTYLASRRRSGWDGNPVA